MSSSCGYLRVIARRSALSSALTGPLPSAGADDAIAVDVHLDGRLDDGLAVLALLDDHAEALEAEQRLARRQLLAQQQLERGVGGLVVVAAVLAILEALEHAADALVVALKLEAELLRLAQHGALAGELGDEDALLVADQLGSTCSKVCGACCTAATCRPPLCAKALRPT